MKKKELNTVDLFCGAGGASTGMEMALASLGLVHKGLAINHWHVAVDTMKANHPDIDTRKMSIEEAIPADLVPGKVVDLLWASPTCTHFSRARGGKPKDKQLRAQPELVVTWLDQLFVRRLIIENVPEFIQWGPLGDDNKPLKSGVKLMEARSVGGVNLGKVKVGKCFAAWINSIRARNYYVQWQIVNCADYGDATTRKRFFLKAVRRGCGRIQWPEPTHARNPGSTVLNLHCEPWRGVRECLDLEDTGTSIFGRDRPLAENTLRRIFVGMEKYNGISFQMDMLGADKGDSSRVRPLTDPLPPQHAGGNRTAVVRPFVVRLNRNCDAESVEEPLSSVQAGGQHHALCTPFIVNNNTNNIPKPLDDPAPSLTTGNHAMLCQPLILDHFKNGKATDGREPLGAQTTHERYSMVTPLVLGQQSGSEARPIDEPCPTIATGGAIRVATPVILDMSRPGGPDSGHVHSADAPIPTITSCDAVQVATPLIIDGVDVSHLPRLPDGRYLDIRIRMLKPSELAAAHSFPKDYKLTGNRTEQVKQIGNSVPVLTAAAMCEADLAAYAA